MNNFFINKKLLLDFSKNNPDKKAVIYNNESISYSKFKNAIISLTKELKRLNVGKADFVAVYMSNSIDMVLSIFAILNCNAIVLPININLPTEQIARILSESNPKIMLYNSNAQPDFIYEKVTTYYVDYKNLDADNKSENELFTYDPNDLAYCIFTSGSSGIPKGVLLTYEGILNHIKAKICLLNLTSESRICLSFNIGFVASIWQILTPILLGAQLYIYDNDLIKKPYQFLEQLELDKVHVVSMIPQSLYAFCYYIWGKHRRLTLLNMKYIIVTGEKVDTVVVKKFYQIYNHISLINAYGQSECSDDTFHFKIPRDFNDTDVPIGKPIPNIFYLILDDNLDEVAISEKGQLYIGGVCLSQSYLNNKQLTNEKFVTISNEKFYRTGDIVRLNQNNDVICLGRTDNQIKIRGHIVEPEEIEAHLNQLPGINQSVVVALEANIIDKILVAYYTSDTDIKSKEIAKYLLSKLIFYKIPSIFKRVEGFFKNVNGKIDRKRVLECIEVKPVVKTQVESHFISSSNELTDIQKRAFDVIVANVSDQITEGISLYTDLNSIGLNSITFIKTFVALECEFDIEFDDKMLLITQFPTVMSIVEYVESKANTN